MGYDMQLIDFYIEVFEGGVNSQDIMRSYVEAKATIKKLTAEFVDYREKSESTVSDLEGKYESTLALLNSLR